MIIIAVLFTTSVFASEYSYKCFSYYWNGENEKGTMILEVNEKNANAHIFAKDWDEKFSGNLDPKYNSQGAIKFAKFGYNVIVEQVLISGGKLLNDGSLGGLARVEGEAEGGFFQYKFICKK